MRKTTLETLKFLYEKALKGELEEEQFRTKFCECFYDKVFLIAINNTSCIQDAEDYTQEIFEKLLQLPFNDFKKLFAGNLTGWLATITKNHCFTRYRLNGKWRTLKDLEQAVNQPHAPSDSHSNKMDYQTMINVLPPKIRVVFVLRWKGFKFKEIAQRLKITEGAAKKRFSDGKKILQKIFK